MLLLENVKQRFESIGWTVEKDIQHGYAIFSNEHAPGEEYCCSTLREVLSYFDECRERAGFDFEPLEFFENDGGRKAAGFKGSAGDCVTRAIAIATDKTYREVYDALGRRQKQFVKDTRSKKINKDKSTTARDGVYREVYQEYLESLGWKWKPTMEIGSGCQVHMRKDELPAGTIICRLSRHISTVIDGVVHDTHNPCRQGTRCVYGYFYKD